MSSQQLNDIEIALLLSSLRQVILHVSEVKVQSQIDRLKTVSLRQTRRKQSQQADSHRVISIRETHREIKTWKLTLNDTGFHAHSHRNDEDGNSGYV